QGLRRRLARGARFRRRADRFRPGPSIQRFFATRAARRLVAIRAAADGDRRPGHASRPGGGVSGQGAVMHSRTLQPLNPLDWLLTPAALCAVASLLLSLPIKMFGLQLP